ncbi:endo-1,4-beta-xylanase [Maribacter sp. 2210JD10-5]|uniref:endo-1,4-beta-xylanase n=1 Tax=Maribacter sp. 2210JD10-5 TaxID=3386272 RepID=UPI0039BD4CDE
MKTKVILFFTLICISVSAQEIQQSESEGLSGLKDYVHTTKLGIMTKWRKDFGPNAEDVDTRITNDIIENEFNSGTVTTYPSSNWDGEREYDLSRINELVNYYYSRNKPIMTHLLFAPNQYFPKWFPKKDYSKKQLRALMDHWLKTIAEANDNGKKVATWNVLNEVFEHHGNGYKGIKHPKGQPGSENEWIKLGYEPDNSGLTGDAKINKEHPLFIREIFETADKYFEGKLELRDWNIEFMEQAKRHGMYQLAAHMVNSDIPLDAIGFQTHISTAADYEWDSFVQNVKSFRALGLETWIVEIDFGDKDRFYNEEEALRQKLINYNLVRAALESGMEWIQYWGLTDGGTWRDYQHALMYDDAFTRKPAYYGAEEALKASERLKVKAKGNCGGEKLYMNIDGKRMASWVLSPEWSDYAYPWFTKDAEISFEIDTSETAACKKDQEKGASVAKLWSYGTEYEVINMKSVKVKAPSSLPKPLKELDIRTQARTYIINRTKDDIEAVERFNIYNAPTIDGFFQRINLRPHTGPEFSISMKQVAPGSVIAITRINDNGEESARTFLTVPN